MNMSTAGMILIIVGWIIQLMNKSNEVNKKFVLVYAIGVLLLVLDAFQSNLTTLAVLNLVSFATAVAVFLKISKG